MLEVNKVGSNPKTLFLPADILRTVVSFLEPKNIARLLTVSSDFYRHLSKNDLWRKLSPRPSTENVKEGFYLALYPEQTGIHLARNARTGNLKVLKSLSGHAAGVRSVKVREQAIISCSGDTTIRITDLSALLQVKSFIVNSCDLRQECLENNGILGPVDVEMKGNRVMTVDWSDYISVQDRFTEEEICNFVGHTGRVNCLTIQDQMIISGSADKTIRVWDSAGVLQRTLAGHLDDVNCLQVIDQTIISGSDDNTICVWDQSQDSPIKVLKGHENAITSLKVSRDAIVSCANDEVIWVWDFSTYALKRTLEGHTNDVTCLEIIDNTIFSCSRDNTMRIWDLSSGNLLQSFEIDAVTCMTYFESHLITGDADGNLKIWGKVES